MERDFRRYKQKQKTKPVAFIPQANNIDRAAASAGEAGDDF
jgi:hypothetical protein